MRICNELNTNMIWQLEKDNRYPQFLRIRHGRLDICLSIGGEMSADNKTSLVLEECKSLAEGRQQWWKFEEF